MIDTDGLSVPLRGTPEEWFAWLTGPDDDLAHQATLILGGLEPDDPVPVESLLIGLTTGRERVPFWATIALGRLGTRAAVAGPLLREVALSHEAFGMRQAALAALVKVAPDDPGTKATVLRALEDENPFVRGEALQALIRIPDVSPADLRRIEALQSDPGQGVAFWAEVALRNLRLR